MSGSRSWQYDEFTQVGKDYGCADEVAVYEETHAAFRDIGRESHEILDRLGLAYDDCIIDFGCGTGVFARTAARRGLRVHAVDVSAAMIDHARKQASADESDRIRFSHAGFLTYEHTGPPAAAIVSTFSFHHLPDFWKQVALRRMSTMLRPDGQLYLTDVVIEDDDALKRIQTFIDAQAGLGGDFLREDAETHFREEFSTFDWVLDGLLQRSGFAIVDKKLEGGIFARYHCRRLRQPD